MLHHVFYPASDVYPIALLVKYSAFNIREIEQNYVHELEQKGIDRKDIIVISLPYKNNGKAPVAFIREQLETIMPELGNLGARYLYCADAEYFKVLTKSAKAEQHLGNSLRCQIPDYDYLQVTLGVNHKSLIYNPANESKMMMSLDALSDIVKGAHQKLGSDIIKSASYPSTLAGIKAELENLHQYPKLSVDIETASLDFEKAGIGTITFCWNKHEGIAFAVDYVPFADGANQEGKYGYFKVNAAVRAELKDFFETYQGTMIWHKAPYDLGVLIYELWMEDLLDTSGLLTGLETLTRSFHDTKIIAFLATNTTAGNELSLKQLAHEFAGDWAQEDIKDITRIPLPKLLEYNLIDGLSTNYVFDKYYPIMEADNQERLYYDLMLPSQKTIIQIEMTGMPLNPAKVAEVRVELEKIRAEHVHTFSTLPTVLALNDQLREDARCKRNAKLKFKQHPIDNFKDPDHPWYVEFNPSSGDQVRVLLYEKMSMPVLDLTKTKLASTSGKTLKKLVNHTTNPEYISIVEALIGFSTAEKILTSFIPAFEKAIDKGDGVTWLHGSFNLPGAVSGRLTSSDPNLQNIPATSVYAKLIKACFCAPDGWIMCGADFNSLEDYISALTTRDPNKLKVYTDGYDGHSLRAFKYFPEQLPGIVDTVESINTIETIHKDVRQDSKPATFLLTYRGTHYGLMKNLGWPEDKARRIEANYHELYKVSDEYVDAKLLEASQRGYVEVAFGLRVRTPLLKQSILGSSSTPYETEAEGRTAANALGQSYGLLNNRAANEFMQRVWESPYRLDIKIIALIHDAIYPLIKDDVNVVDWVNRNLIECMQWQELPELAHPTVKLGAELSLFWPSWANEINLPNGCSKDQIRALCKAARGQ
jgi:DNA polymerase I